MPHTEGMTGERLDGGNVGGAVRIGDTVRRATGPWTPAVHALLNHLAAKGFQGAPRVLGIDEEGREILSYLDGETVGSRKPWPAWVHAEATLDQVAHWLRGFHEAVADFVPPPGSVWRALRPAPGWVVGHNDAAPYNAAWRDGRLVGFFDWDFAGPVAPGWDLAFTAFSWTPLHARHVVTAEGFTDFPGRERRLRRFLDAYGWSGNLADFRDLVRDRLQAQLDGLRRVAAAGDPVFVRLLEEGGGDLARAIVELPALG